jgi:BMFP domain-containing protein YqiC
MSEGKPKDINAMSDEEIEVQLQEKLPEILKMSETEWRESIVRDYNLLARIVIVSQQILDVANKNFGSIANWMKKTDERLQALEEKLAFLETQSKNNDPKKKKDFYLQ